MSVVSYASAVSYVDTGQEANVSEEILPILPGSTTLSTPVDRLPQNLPVAIPASQMYYWTRVWQEGERRALEELERGEGRCFDDSRDAIRWLLSPEE
jgi:hypothetical protein